MGINIKDYVDKKLGKWKFTPEEKEYAFKKLKRSLSQDRRGKEYMKIDVPGTSEGRWPDTNDYELVCWDPMRRQFYFRCASRGFHEISEKGRVRRIVVKESVKLVSG